MLKLLAVDAWSVECCWIGICAPFCTASVVGPFVDEKYRFLAAEAERRHVASVSVHQECEPAV